jgi:hypothetical protein
MPPKEIPDELIDALLAGREGPEAIRGCPTFCVSGQSVSEVDFECKQC